MENIRKPVRKGLAGLAAASAIAILTATATGTVASAAPFRAAPVSEMQSGTEVIKARFSRKASASRSRRVRASSRRVRRGRAVRSSRYRRARSVRRYRNNRVPAAMLGLFGAAVGAAIASSRYDDGPYYTAYPYDPHGYYGAGYVGAGYVYDYAPVYSYPYAYPAYGYRVYRPRRVYRGYRRAARPVYRVRRARPFAAPRAGGVFRARPAYRARPVRAFRGNAFRARGGARAGRAFRRMR